MEIFGHSDGETPVTTFFSFEIWVINEPFPLCVVISMITAKQNGTE